jgi:hypothetical protein
MAHATPQQYLVRLRSRNGPVSMQQVLESAFDDRARLVPAGDAEHYRLGLADDVILGDALAALSLGGIQVLACREEKSEIEEAFLALTGDTE